jgi:hypothetical protein
MAKIALDENNPLDLRARMFAELAPYVRPKLSAQKVDMDANIGGSLGDALLAFASGKTVSPAE